MPSFFEGFADSFAKSSQQRKMRDQLRLEDAKEQRREAQQAEQFQQRRQDQEKQFQAMEQFRAKQNEFRATQLGLQQRAADLEFVKGFSKIFDPKTTKGAKKLMLGTMATHLGIDRKGQQFKDLETYLSGMEEEEQKNFGAALMAAVPNAQPGQIKAMTKAMFTEGLTVTQAADLLDKATKKQTIQKINEQFDPMSGGGAQRSQLLAPQSLGEAQPKPGLLEQQQAQIKRATEHRDALLQEGLTAEANAQQNIIDGLSKAGEMNPELRGAVKSAEIKAEDEAELDQLASPKHLRLVGVDPNAKMTKRHARNLGIDTDLDNDTVMDLSKRKAAVHSTMKQIDELTDMIEPGAIGVVGTTARAIDSFLSQAGAVTGVLGMNRAEFGKATKKAETTMGLAVKSAIIRSRIVDLSYDMAKARDGGRLSNQDIERFQEMLGKSNSEPQFKAVLQDMKDRLRSGASTDIESLTGVKPVDLMTKEELDTAIDEFEDEDMIMSIIKEQKRRKKEFGIRGQK